MLWSNKFEENEGSEEEEGWGPKFLRKGRIGTQFDERWRTEREMDPRCEEMVGLDWKPRFERRREWP